MGALDMERICRLCCRVKARMRPLFEQRKEYPLALAQMIYAIADLKVDSNDGMPQKICSQCVTDLMKIYRTIQSYRENDLSLRKQLSRTTPDEVDDTVEIEEMNLKQEVAKEDNHGSESLLKPTNDSVENRDAAAADDESISTEMDIRIKNESLEEHDEESEHDVTDRNMSASLTAVQENEPIRKLSRRHRKSAVVKEKLLKRKSPRSHRQSTIVQAKEPIRKEKRERRKVKTSKCPSFYDYICYICESESHETGTALLVHMNTDHKDLLPFTCTKCKTKTVVLNTLLGVNKHLRQHFNPEKCPHCDKRYTTKSYVAKHVQQQHRSEAEDGTRQHPEECNQCDEQFPSRISLNHHIYYVHSAKTTVSCEECGAVFDKEGKLRFHLYAKHGHNNGRFECNICQKKLSAFKKLHSHIKNFHSNLKEFKCSYCPKAYGTIASKRDHEKRHTRNPNYRCKPYLAQHYTTLEGQEGLKKKKCKCNICGKITKRIADHLRIRHFPTEYKCEICGKTSNRKDHVRQHMKTHLRTEPQQRRKKPIEADAEVGELLDKDSIPARTRSRTRTKK